MKRLVFVYNADAGLFNLASDIAHKIFSPSTYSCQLCNLAYGYFSVRDEWSAFLASAPFESRFLHRDEFRTAYPNMKSVPLPAVFVEQDEKLELCLDSESIKRCEDLAELQSLILESCH